MHFQGFVRIDIFHNFWLGGKRRAEYHKYPWSIKAVTEISVDFPGSMHGKWTNVWEGSYDSPKALISRKSSKREKKALVGGEENRL